MRSCITTPSFGGSTFAYYCNFCMFSFGFHYEFKVLFSKFLGGKLTVSYKSSRGQRSRDLTTKLAKGGYKRSEVDKNPTIGLIYVNL